MKLRENDVICALATPPGVSALAVVRLSGPYCGLLATKITRDLNFELIKPRQAYLCSLYDSQGSRFEQALVLFFSEGQSYTGQESVEFFCHGSMVIVEHLISELCLHGARLAEPGEFTYRAFMNGKLDLIQAEGVLNLIHSDSVSQAKQGLRHLEGEFSQVVLQFEQDLLGLLAEIEAGIDFATEGIEFQSESALYQKSEALRRRLVGFVDKARNSRLIKQGIQVALVGEPNSGKSSLLNNLLGESRALVTEFAGTTRDVLDGTLLVDGIKVVVFDTAGLRATDDTIESMGVAKAVDVAKKADLVLWLINPHHQSVSNSVLFDSLSFFDPSVIQPVLTHLDLGKRGIDLDLSPYREPIWISNLDTQGVRKTVIQTLRAAFGTSNLIDQSLLIHSKQRDLLHKTSQSLTKAVEELSQGMGHEIVALSLRESLRSIQSVLGKDYDDQILDRIFSEFCIGK